LQFFLAEVVELEFDVFGLWVVFGFDEVAEVEAEAENHG
jgi:hypothetical protein